MAQVKKLEGGGTPSKKYLMFNGTKIVEGDDNFKQLEQYALNGNRGAQSMLNTLRSNNYDNSMIVNTSDTGVDFKNVDMSYYNDRTGKQFEKGDNFWRRNFRTKEGKDYIKDFTALKFAAPATEEKKEDIKLGILSHGNDADFVYHDQEDGTKLYSTGPQNMQNEKIIRDIFSNFGSSREELEKKYNFDNWGENYWTLQNWRNSNLDYNVEDLITRIREGKTTDTDLELLQLMRFNVSKPDVKKKELTGLEWDDEFTKGLTNADVLKQAAARRGVGIKRSDDGKHWILTGNKDFTNGTWYTGDLDFLEGTDYARGAIHNGRLFTNKQVLDGDVDIVQHISPYISAWRGASDYRSGYDAANNSGVRFVGDRLWNNASTDNYGPFHTQFDPSKQYNRTWSRYFDELGVDKTWNITDVTNAYDGLNGKQVMAYIDPNEQDKRGIGMYGADWVVYNPSNLENPYQTFEDEISMRNNLGLSQISDPYGFGGRDFKTSTWTNIGDHAYAEYASIKTKGNQENTILIGADGNMYYARKDQAGTPVDPKRIKNLALLEKVLANPEQYDNNVFVQLTKKKNGGILKHQYGGAVHSSKTVSSVKNTEDAKSDITKDHKLNGEDGGLTQAEKMQIGAAIGDLAGVGISFMGPIGNVAGAVTGLGATATRFAADVKQDGFQAKDAWNAAGGALLDLASVLPFIGAGAKTAKALKVIKSAASPIMKALSLAGAANGAVAMSKVIAGEDITSQDLQAIIGGLGSSVIAGKQFKDMIGDAKFASLLSKRTAAGINANKNTVPKATISETEIVLDPSKVKGKSIVEVESYIKNTAKEKLGRDLTEDESKGLLDKFGLSTTKGERVGMKWKNLWKWKNPVIRKSEKVDFETPSDVTGHSAWYYAVNPFSRNKTLGKSWHGFGENAGNLEQISQSDIRAAQTRIANKQGTLSDYALMRRVIDNPNAFGDIFEGNPYRMNWFGYPAYARKIKDKQSAIDSKDASPAQLLLPETNISHNVYTPSVMVTRAINNPVTVSTPVLGLPGSTPVLGLPPVSTWQYTGPNNNFVTGLIRPQIGPNGGFIMYKQGGILKGKYGLSFNDAKRAAFDKWGITKDSFNPKPYTITAPEEEYVEETIPSIKKSAVQQQTNTTNSTTSGDGSISTLPKFDKIDAIELGKFGQAWLNADAYGRNRKKQLNNSLYTTHKIQDSDFRTKLYTDNLMRPTIANSRLQSRLFTNSIGDHKLAAAYNLSNESNILNTSFNINKDISDKLDKQDAIRYEQKYKTQLANNSLYDKDAALSAAVRSGIPSVDNEVGAIKSGLLDSAGLYKQNKLYSDDRANFYVDQQLQKLDTAIAYAKPEEQIKLQQVRKNISSPEYLQNVKNMYKYGTLSAAKGGKLRSTSDQMLIDNQKLVAKAIEKLNDNTMKLILKALS